MEEKFPFSSPIYLGCLSLWGEVREFSLLETPLGSLWVSSNTFLGHIWGSLHLCQVHGDKGETLIPWPVSCASCAGPGQKSQHISLNKGILLPLKFCIWNSQSGLGRVVPGGIYLRGKPLGGKRDSWCLTLTKFTWIFQQLLVGNKHNLWRICRNLGANTHLHCSL